MALNREGWIVVTGGAGLIGSALVWALNQKGHERILVVDQLGSDEKWKNLVPLRFGDYLEGEELRAVLADDPDALGEIDTVFHLGACSATTEKDAGYLMDNNYAFTRDLAHWALEVGAKFVYASSAATYGDGSLGMDDQTEALSRLRPLNAYGYSKHLFDCYAQRAGLLEQLIGLKYFNVYGPNEHHKGEMRSVVHKAYHQIQETGRVGLFKSYHPDYQDGCQMRDFLYVKDAVEMTIHLATAPSAGGLYNIGSGEASTWLRLAQAIFAALGKDPQIDFVEMPEQLRGKYQYYTCAGVEKLTASGWSQGAIALEEAVKDYVGEYLVPGRFLGDE
ncbi:MAG: ADP-glyceromanno-heptose 6-epimerase [Verrucomicrobiota bacterium]